MSADLAVLALAAVSLGVVHTILGPDHYLPFLAMGRASGWSRRRTLAVTAACGTGHVLGSIVLGCIGIALGFAVASVEALEATRGRLAAWMLLALGVLYLVWGLRRARLQRAHKRAAPSVTPWVLFAIFVLGPCEPMIPLLMYPAAVHSPGGVALVALLYGVATIATMVFAVWICHRGVERLPLANLERYTHAAAGGTVALCGAAILTLGL